MKLKFICCEVFMREACLSISLTPNIVDPDFTPKGAHEKSDYLRSLIQEKIDAVEETGDYDAIILGFGLCGNSIAGLKARSIPIVIPRAHDCCTIFLGSRSRFVEYFGNNLSAEWSSAGYMERGDSYLRETDTGILLGVDKSYDQLVEQYGEENAEYIWETINPKQISNEIIYIDTPETKQLGFKDKLEKSAIKDGKSLRVIEGDMRLLTNLIFGKWDENEFLIVHPGKEVQAEYDMEKIISC